MQGTYVVGVQLVITNRALAKWSCSYVGDRGGRGEEVLSNRAAQQKIPPSSVLRLFVVSTNPVLGGQFIDTREFPKLGFIGPASDMVISTIQGALVQQHQISRTTTNNATRWTFTIYLTPSDAKQLESMTAMNVSKRVLLTLNDEPIAAPTIVAPLVTGSFTIACRDEALMAKLKEELAEMQRPAQP
jgi:preprotein translocase subunit SecD